MRWAVTPAPREGDVRIRKVFALFPAEVGGCWAWLEHY